MSYIAHGGWYEDAAKAYEKARAAYQSPAGQAAIDAAKSKGRSILEAGKEKIRSEAAAGAGKEVKKLLLIGGAVILVGVLFLTRRR